MGSSQGERPRSISVLMPILNGEAFLERVLEGLRIQECSLPWDFTAADCGSTDRTLEIFARQAKDFPVPLRVHGISRAEFNHGDTRNLLASLSEGELLMFLTDDAIPVGSDWLERFVSNFEDPEVVGAYLRNTPRPEADILAQVFSEGDHGYRAGRTVTRLPEPARYETLDGNDRRLLFNFNDTASATRRSFWERHPYPHLDFGEDVVQCQAMLESGFGVVYDDSAVIHHSHEYPADVSYLRAKEDGAFNAERLNRICLHEPFEVDVLTARQLVRDREALVRRGYEGPDLEAEAERAGEIRKAYFKGLLEGGRSPKRFRMSTALSSSLPGAKPSLYLSGVPSNFREALLGRGWQACEERAGADVVHVHGDSEAARALVAAAVADRQATLWTVDAAWAGRVGMGKDAMTADELADANRVAEVPAVDFGQRPTEVPLLAWVWRTAEDVSQRRGPTAERVVPWEEERVRTAEFHYRALACRARARREVDWRGADASRLAGSASQLDGELVLLEGDDGSAEWDLSAARPGTKELRIHLKSLPGEVAQTMGGRAFLDGEPIGDLGPYRSCGGHETRILRLPLTLPPTGDKPSPRVLRLESGLGAGVSILRVARVVLIDPDVLGPDMIDEHTVDLRGQDARLEGAGAVAIEDDLAQVTGLDAQLSWSFDDLQPGLWELRFWLYFGAEEGNLLQWGRVLVDGIPVARFGPHGPPAGGGHREVALLVRVDQPTTTFQITNTQQVNGTPGLVRVRRFLARPAPVGEPGFRMPSGAGLTTTVIGPFPRDEDTPSPPAGSDPLSRSHEDLYVEHGPPLDDDDLPSVGVIVVNCDGRSMLMPCLASILASNYPKDRMRVVVVDNGSTDGSVAWLQGAHPDVTVVANGRNEGFTPACNQGVRAAGDVEQLVFLNNDLEVEPDCLRELVGPIVRGECESTGAKLLSGDGKTLDHAGGGSNFQGIAVAHGYKEVPDADHERPRRVLFACGGGMAISTAVFHEIGGFDEDFFAYYDDLDIGWRTNLAGHRVHYAPRAVARHHHSGTSRRFPFEQIRLLQVRNALLCAIKNYDDENFNRLLPAILALAMRRMWVFAHVGDDSEFRIEATDPRTQRGWRSVWRRMRRRLPFLRDHYKLNRVAAGDFFGINDVLGRWEHWMSVRGEIQKLRKVPDDQLFEMFLKPLWCIEGEKGYIDLQHDLLDRYGMLGKLAGHERDGDEPWK